VNPIANVPAQLQAKRLDTDLFRAKMVQEPAVSLYAVYADPKQLEAGHHPYWLVETLRHPYKAPKGLKDGLGVTIREGTWIVDAHWFKCKSDDPTHKAYQKLHIELAVPADNDAAPNENATHYAHSVVHLPMKAFVTEVQLEWARYSPRLESGVLSDHGHLAIMKHNFSNITSP